MNRTQIRRPVFHIKLDIDSSPQVRLSLVQRASLDDRLAGHDLQLREQTRATVPTEEMLVNLATVAGHVEGFGRSWSSG